MEEQSPYGIAITLCNDRGAMKKSNARASHHGAKRHQQAMARRQRAAASHPRRPGPVWLKGNLEDRVSYAMLALYYGKEDEGEAILAALKRTHPAHPLVRELPIYARMLRGDYSKPVMQAWRRSAQRQRTFPQPLWDGAPHPDQRLLIWWPPWGHGDVLQWARMLSPTKAQFQGHVTFEVRPGLSRLLQGLPGPDAIIEPEPEGPFDWQLPHDLLPTSST
jgi:hypothetical protein